MGKKKREEETFICPVGRFFMDLDKVWGSNSPFHKHLNQSRIEFLKTLRAMMDERIDTLEKKQSGKAKRATRIRVE
jgi:hypothetical protein